MPKTWEIKEKESLHFSHCNMSLFWHVFFHYYYFLSGYLHVYTFSTYQKHIP